VVLAALPTATRCQRGGNSRAVASATLSTVAARAPLLPGFSMGFQARVLAGPGAGPGQKLLGVVPVEQCHVIIFSQCFNLNNSNSSNF
jgi:hypothetical protein